MPLREQTMRDTAAQSGKQNPMQFVSDADHSKAFDHGQLQALSVMHYSYGLTFNIVAIFLGLGSTIFNYLFFKSKYIPRALASWGIFSSLLLLLNDS